MKTPTQNIEWHSVKARLASGQAGLSNAVHEDRARLEVVYRQRAQRLATRRLCDAGQSARTPVLTFCTGSERFGIDVAYVAQVFARPPITPIPGAVQHLLGVANLQGKVRSVIDLGRLLNLAPRTPDGGYIVLMRAGDASIGLWIESVEGIRHVDFAALVTTDASVRDRLSGVVKGTAADCIAILDPEALIGHVRHSCFQQTTSRGT
jgi:purine-binding chemotaxis protein CheW